jgi:hypothetical protein
MSESEVASLSLNLDPRLDPELLFGQRATAVIFGDVSPRAVARGDASLHAIAAPWPRFLTYGVMKVGHARIARGRGRGFSCIG